MQKHITKLTAFLQKNMKMIEKNEQFSIKIETISKNITKRNETLQGNKDKIPEKAWKITKTTRKISDKL